MVWDSLNGMQTRSKTLGSTADTSCADCGVVVDTRRVPAQFCASRGALGPLLYSKLYTRKADRKSAQQLRLKLQWEDEATFVAKNKGVTGLMQRKKGMKYEGSSAQVERKLEKQEATRGNGEKDYEDDRQSGHEIPQEKQTQSIVFRRSGKRRNKVKVPRSVLTAPKMRRRNYNAYLNRRRRQRVGRKRLRKFVPQKNGRLIRKKKISSISIS